LIVFDLLPACFFSDSLACFAALWTEAWESKGLKFPGDHPNENDIITVSSRSDSNQALAKRTSQRGSRLRFVLQSDWMRLKVIKRENLQEFNPWVDTWNTEIWIFIGKSRERCTVQSDGESHSWRPPPPPEVRCVLLLLCWNASDWRMHKVRINAGAFQLLQFTLAAFTFVNCIASRASWGGSFLLFAWYFLDLLCTHLC
jgi:hypothetical protein